MRSRYLPIALACVFATCAARAADEEKKSEDKKPDDKWDVTAAHGAITPVKFSTREGTWMNVDVSPDGKQIAFDLVGDIYLLPIEGGKARRLLGGPAFEIQPRFSPDGQEISFTSDRGGGDNIWRVRLDGSGLTQVSKEDFRLLNNAVWTPDGQYLIARKHFTSERSLGAGEMWMFHKSGGAGLQLTKKKNDQQDAGEPAISPDGRYVYFSEDVSSGPTFQYNKNANGTLYAIRRLDRESGEIVNLISNPGGAVRPQPSPDGKSLAFVKRIRGKSVLHTLDLKSGAIVPIWDGLSHDQQEAWAVFGPYPDFAWTPDSKHVVVWAQGKLWKIDIAARRATDIPFEAEIEQNLASTPKVKQRLDGDSFVPQMIRDVDTSPDGRTLVFHAVGHLWKKILPDGKPQRLTKDDARFEYSPSFAPNGKSLLYISWSDTDLSAIRSINLDGGGAKTLSAEPGFYFAPRYSRDGSKIVYAKQAGGNLVDYRYSFDTGVYWMPASGGAPARIAKDAYDAYFDAAGRHVLYMSGNGQSKKLMSVALSGAEAREIFNLKYVNNIVPSPDGRWVAFNELFNAYVAPLPQTGNSIELSKDSKAIPITRVSEDVGDYLHWSADSKRLHWMVGTGYFSRELSDSFAFLPGAPKELPKPATAKGIDVGLSVSTDRPEGRIALTHARIVTMKGDEVIEDGSVLIERNRIVAVGTDVAIPAGTKTIDASGKTIIPGIIDVHAHANHFSRGPSPQANWTYYANLAYGVTTMHDPSANTQEVFSQSELVKAGLNIGPRVFSTGTILYGADGDFKAVINSLDDARSHLRRMKAHGAFSVKSYNQPRRDQRQQINEAARELGMMVVMEGGSTQFHNVTMILDGSTSIEHNLPVAPLYQDILGLWAKSEVRYTPTLVVSFGGVSGEYWWYQHTNVWEEERLLRFYPRDQLDARSVRRQTMPDSEYYHIEVAKAVKAAHDAGVRVQIGGHGQLAGLSPNWEIWSLVQGGFTPHQALEAATISGADYLGLERDLGSIEVGKAADLVVLANNPLENIQATKDVAMVMVNGRLFDGATMAEIGNHPRPAPQFFWQKYGTAAAAAAGFTRTGPTAECHCPKSHDFED